MKDYTQFDQALESMAAAGPDLRSGMSNHAPMAAEALCAMGRGDAVMRWLEGYRRGLAPRPPRAEAVTEGNWRCALGDIRRSSDWFEFFRIELQEHPWREVLDTWAARLAPGLSGAATHGVIRAGHAVRAIALEQTPTRRRELADGLGYWAACFQALPAGPAPAAGARRPRQAILNAPIVPPEQRKYRGTISGSLERLDRFPAFADVIAMADLSGDPAAAISELTETFASVYLANAHDTLTSIVFVHAVTSAAALRSMLPHLGPATAREALRYAWQAGCALYAAFGLKPVPRYPIEPPRESGEALIDMAIANGDEHAIKFTEACLRESALNPSPSYLAAARHAIGALKG